MARTGSGWWTDEWMMGRVGIYSAADDGRVPLSGSRRGAGMLVGRRPALIGCTGRRIPFRCMSTVEGNSHNGSVSCSSGFSCFLLCVLVEVFHRMLMYDISAVVLASSLLERTVGPWLEPDFAPNAAALPCGRLAMSLNAWSTGISVPATRFASKRPAKG